MTSIDFVALRQTVSISQILDLIEWKPLAVTSSSERGPCPVHKSQKTRQSRSFSVDRAGNRFQWFKCGAKGNQLDLYGQVRKLAIYPAAVEICEKLGIPVPENYQFYKSREQRRGTRRR